MKKGTPETKQFAAWSDEDLVREILRDGKSDLFGVLYDRYANKVYGKCLSFFQDRDQAQDMVQEILVKAYSRLAAFRLESRFSTWLYAITYNYCVEQYRKNQRYPHQPVEDDLVEPADEAREESALLALQVDQLKYALEQIAPEDKALLLMKYQDDMSIKDIMEQMGLQESAVKMRLSRARNRVKEVVNRQTGGRNG